MEKKKFTSNYENREINDNDTTSNWDGVKCDRVWYIVLYGLVILLGILSVLV